MVRTGEAYRPMYYDKDGTPLKDTFEWAKKMEDREYKIVKQEKIPFAFVSTVWLGLDHQFGSGAPLIFETMVFVQWLRGHEVYCERYSTLQEAISGHNAVMNDQWHYTRLAICALVKDTFGRVIEACVEPLRMARRAVRKHIMGQDTKEERGSEH